MTEAKPMGPIPPYFAADDDGMLLIGRRRADALVDEAGDTPLFVYDGGVVARRIAALRAAMPPQLHIHYAVKANPFAPLLHLLAGLVDGFDIASDGELDFANAAGMDAERISFAGPGKRDRELLAAIRAGVTINLESAGEARRALAIADREGKQPRLAVRVNPPFDLKGSGMRMGGGAKPFGIDAAHVPGVVQMLRDAGADWRGYHIFAGSQALDAAAIAEAQGATLDLVRSLSENAGGLPATVNLGGGFGVPYFAGDVPVDIEAIGEALGRHPEFERLQDEGVSFAIELGRWIVAECGVYLTRIVDRKASHDSVFLVCDGGLHHQLAASGNFGTVVRRNYPLAIANSFGAAPTETVSVVGPLCTPLDRLGDMVALPQAGEGDLVAVFLAGAYGRSASPEAFLGHPAPLELLLEPFA